ncbi:MAG: pantothenate kinase [candidate division Zixibacteria bacterium CG_4_9_14_3_um_filter_46_8]|nr:MAG: pantothenate kinase [candidate division Zixibacteria bacterium CG_4_9_14_3_um_filter_46_8]
MLLAIDIGNTNTVVGIYKEDLLLSFFRLSSRENITSDEAGFGLRNICNINGACADQIDSAILCSVVPTLTAVYDSAIQKYFNIKPFILTHKSDIGITIDYEIPNQVGADRLADAVGAYHKYGGPTIIVDLGTAITVDAISSKGVYLGGAIAPGVEASLAGLSKRAAQLFQVPLNSPKRALGKNTVESIQAGIIFGAAGLIDGLVSRIASEIGEPLKRVVATGGLAEMVRGISKTINEINLTLTLDGLNIIYQRNMKKRSEVV